MNHLFPATHTDNILLCQSFIDVSHSGSVVCKHRPKFRRTNIWFRLSNAWR